MRLKRLEIVGFKSFPDRTTVLFDDGITGVVGPNGSGKSNIADAVRWVLGEQSPKTLRGARMEDVIFGGTQKRRALNYCEVALTFDNSDHSLPLDYEEVTVSRKVYRNGDSEYALNKTACRLKEIIELFRDTGIGKEGYSIIGQGRVDEILSARSEDRRAVFEEAAGIAKHKARRQESERRLETTEQNLDRLRDILGEVGAKLPLLEKQSAAARQSLFLMTEQKTVEANLYLIRHTQLEEDIAAAETQAEALRARQKELERDRAYLRAAMAALEGDMQEADATIREKSDRVLTLTREAQLLKGECDVLEQRIASARADVARLKQEEERDARSADEAARSAKEADQKQAALLAKAEAQEAAITAIAKEAQERSAHIAALEDLLQKANTALLSSFDRLTLAKAQAARVTAQREALSAQLSKAKEDRAFGEARLDAAETKMKQAKADEEKAAAALSALRAAVATTAKQQSEQALLLLQTQQTREELTGAQRESQSRLRMLEQMKRDYEGYQNSVRELLRRFSDDPYVYGVVANNITVPKDLEKALEQALGGAMQNIVCASEQDAQRMIETLRRERLGRATFLPLASVKGRTLSPQERRWLTEPGCLGVASELVRFEPRFRGVIENLLGRTVIAKDLNSGIPLMRKAGHSFRLVTLDGDVINPGGSMSGGSTPSRTTSLLSREREIGEYRKANEKL